MSDFIQDQKVYTVGLNANAERVVVETRFHCYCDAAQVDCVVDNIAAPEHPFKMVVSSEDYWHTEAEVKAFISGIARGWAH